MNWLRLTPTVLFALIFATHNGASAQSYDISTIAGASLPTLPALATSVSIGFTQFTAAIDSAGNFYFVDSGTNSVYEVSAGGSLSRFAGNGYPGFTGDGGPANTAQLFSPSGVAIDGSGNLYIVDTGNECIRKVSAGVISTVAGDGAYGYSGDGGPATSAELANPEGIAIDSHGNLFIADTSNSVIREVSASGTISTVAGNGVYGYSGDGGGATAAQLSYPYGIAVDSTGDLFIADMDNHVVRKVASGIITTFAGNGTYGYSGDGGPAVSAELGYISSVTVGPPGTLYIADPDNSRVRVVSPAGTITTIAGNGNYGFSGDGGPATSATLNYPEAVVAVSNGSFYILDTDNYRVRLVSSAGIISTVAGDGFDNYSGDNGPATLAQINGAEGVAVSPSGNVLIADTYNYAIRQVSSAGTITTVAGNETYGYSGDNGPAVNAQISEPFGIATDSAGNFYIADSDNYAVRKVSTSGIITTIAGGNGYGYAGDGGRAIYAQLSYVGGVAVDSAGSVFIADTGNNVVRVVTPDGTISTLAGNGTYGFSGDGGPATSAEFESPYGVSADVSGDVFIADTGNARVRKVNASNGVVTTIAGNGIPGYTGDNGPATSAQISYAYGLTVDSAGNLYIGDTDNYVIREVTPGGIITTIAGYGYFGYSGDGGPAVDAAMSYPSGVAIGAGSVVYIADTDNNAIRELTHCPESVGPTITADGTAQTLNSPLTATSGCQWSASNLPSWITSASSGIGSGTLALTFQANTTGADRTAAILINSLSVTVTQRFTISTFSDVAPSSYQFDAVNLLAAKGITTGCAAGMFCPTESVTRDQMAVFLVRTVLGTDTFTYSPTPYFQDVPTTYWAFPYIQKFYELGITSGCAPSTYCPTEILPREQMAIFIIRTRYGTSTPFTWNPTPYFADVPSGAFGFDQIQRMYQDGITTGCSSNPLDYCPNNLVVRGDMAIFIMRGGFNQLIPSTEPVISSIAPTSLTAGTTGTFTVTGVNTTFQQGVTALVFGTTSGVTVNSILVTSPTTMTVSLTAASTAPLTPVSIYEQTEPEEAVLPNGLMIQ